MKAATTATEALTAAVYDEIIARVQLSDVTLPAPKGRFADYSRTVEGLEHPIHRRRPADAPPPAIAAPGRVLPTAPADEAEQIILDVNVLAESTEHLEVGGLALSDDQQLLAYSTDTTGGERFTIRIRELEEGADLDDTIEDASSGLGFSAGGRGCSSTRAREAMRPFQIWCHVLGTPTTTDRCIWEEADERFFLSVATTKDAALIVLGARSNVTSEIRILDAANPDGEPRIVEPRRQGVEYSIEHHAGEILVLTNDAAENFAVFRAPVTTPGREHWRPLVENREDVRLEGLDVVHGFALLHERGHASTAVRIVDLASGADTVIVPGEEAGSVFLGENLDFSTLNVRYESTSLVSPVAVHEHSLDTGESRVIWRRQVPNFDPAAYRTERRWAISGDGTKVPMTIVYRADRPSGPGPCVLYGYGADQISINPVFAINRSVLPLLDRGGCYVIADVRGGGGAGPQMVPGREARAETAQF